VKKISFSSKFRLAVATKLVRIARRVHMDVLMKFSKPVTVQQVRSQNWYAIDGDNTLRLQYPLDEHSMVFDLGGYHGDWSAAIEQLYSPYIYVFEPVENYANQISERFKSNPKIKVFPFGLSNGNFQEKIYLNENGTSTFRGDEDRSVNVQFIEARDFITEHVNDQIDLMKINIEGGEYDLLEHLIASGLVAKIVNIQVQFHDFVPLALRKMAHIQDKLSLTHELTYQYEFMWENWRLKTSIT
jgi:FkbM family methyltransferase